MTNLLADIPTALPQELIETLKTTANVRIERIVSHGHASPPGFWYDQDQGEFVVVLQGAARLWFEGEKEAIAMTPGCYVDIPAHRRHRVEWTAADQQTIWLAIHYQ